MRGLRVFRCKMSRLAQSREGITFLLYMENVHVLLRVPLSCPMLRA